MLFIAYFLHRKGRVKSVTIVHFNLGYVAYGMTDNKRPMVYISADPKDSGEFLYTLNRVVVQLGGLPVQSYYRTDSGDYDWPLVRSIIDECQVFILLVGDGYGGIAETGESYIHREAVYAKSKQKITLALLKNAELQSLSRQEMQRLKSLHRLMMSGIFKYWSSKEELLLIARQVLRDHLKPQLKLSSSTPPHAPETRMQAVITDTLFEMGSYPMRFSGKVFAHGNCQDVHLEVSLSWRSAFLNMGTSMTSPVTEERMRGVLEDFVAEHYRQQFLSKVADAHALADVRCNAIAFQRMKAYLKGAGVIENVAHQTGGLRNYWQLTTRGEHKLHELLIPS